MRPGVLSVAMVIGLLPSLAHAQRQVSALNAVVRDKQVVIAFPAPYTSAKRPASTPLSFYAWRIFVEAPVPFTMVLMADTAMRSSKPEDILRASSLRLCPTASPRSVLECTRPLEASTELYLQYFRLTIRDTSIVARMRRERPLMYWRSVIEPNGRIQLVQQRWEYEDNSRR